MSKRNLLIGSMCLVASCNLYEELQVPTYDALRPAQRDEEPGSTSSDFQSDGPSSSSNAGAADSGSADAASGAGSAPDAYESGAGREAPAASSGGAGAAGSGGAAPGPAEPVAAAGSPAAGNHAAGSGGAGAGAGGAGAAGSGTTDPACIEDGGQTWRGNGHCYFRLLTQATWNVSRDQCAHADAKLAAITTTEELDFVTGLLGDSPAWIGFSKFGAPQFSWSTGEANGYTNWAAGEPDLSGEAAVAMHHDTGKWFDDAVNASHSAICERP
jgi:hypothetical protein